GEVFVGFSRGDVSCYRAERGELRQVLAASANSLAIDGLNRTRRGDLSTYQSAVAALATSPQGGALLALLENGTANLSLITLSKDRAAMYKRVDERHMDISAEAGLTPVAMFFGVPRYAIWDDNQLLWLTGLSPQIVNGSLTWSSLYRGRLGA